MEEFLKSKRRDYLRKLASHLGIKNGYKLKKAELIVEINKFSQRKILSTEKKILSIKKSKRHIEILGKSIHPYLLIVVGAVLVILGTLFLLYPASESANYSKLILAGKVEFYTENTNGDSDYLNDIAVNPICGCAEERPHYGLTFFPNSYKIKFDYANNLKKSFRIDAPNHVILSIEDPVEKQSGNYFSKAYHEPFSLSYSRLIIPKKYYFQYNNFKEYLQSEFRFLVPNLKFNSTKSLRINNFSKQATIVSLDDVKMGSVVPPVGTKVIVDNDNSSIQDKSLGQHISFDLISVQKGNYFNSEIDLLGTINAIVFDQDVTMISKDEYTLGNDARTDSLTVFFLVSEYSQRISPIDKIMHFEINVDSPLSDKQYDDVLKLFREREKNYYYATLEEFPPIELSTPFIQNRPNGIHYYGNFKSLYSSETTGEINIGAMNKKIRRPSSVKVSNMDSLELITQPLIIHSNDFEEFKNIISYSGDTFLNDELIEEESFLQRLVTLWNTFYIIISLIGIIITIAGVRKL